MTSAPPPSVYVGFSSGNVKRGQKSGHSKSSSHKDCGGTGDSGVYWRSDGDRTKTHQRSHPTSKSNRVRRKVHSFVTGSGEGNPTDVITPSSWRSGKELAEKILRDLEKDREHSSKSNLIRHSPKNSHRVYHQDSLDSDRFSRSLSDVDGSHTSLPVAGESQHTSSLLGDKDSHDDIDARSDVGSEVSSHSSVLDSHPRALQLSSDMDKLLEELRATSNEVNDEEVEVKKRRYKGRRYKPQYNFGQ